MFLSSSMLIFQNFNKITQEFLKGVDVGFQNLDIKTTYDSGVSGVDVVKSFYLPVLEHSTRYDRVAGYFSSKVFASVARGIAGIVRNNGKIRLVTSHVLTKKDSQVLKDFYDSEEFANSLIENFTQSFRELDDLGLTISKKHVEALCWLLKEGFLEIRIVVPNSADLVSLDPSEIEKFHPKFGIMYDDAGLQIAFSGSINETEGAWRRNIENFDAYPSWLPGRSDYIEPKILQFEKYWNSELDSNWKTIKLPEAVKHKIISDFAPEDFPRELERTSVGINIRPLRDYQQRALDSWIESNRIGILEMATGTGKTRTARACLESTLELGNLLTVVIVPYQHIGSQWQNELNAHNPVIITGDWRKKMAILQKEASLGRSQNLLLVVVKNTASHEDFSKGVENLSKYFENTLLIADEVHWLGAKSYQSALLNCANYRLGLSATPNRYFDDDGTKILYDYFLRTVYELSISDALQIKDENGQFILCPYIYKPIFVDLTHDEIDLYRELTQKINVLKNLENAHEFEAQIQNLYIKRALIVKKAASKLPSLKALLDSLEFPLKHTLIYCSDFNQLNDSAAILNEMNVPIQQITGEESTRIDADFNFKSERDHILKNFADGHLDILLAIDCLDEGVDIPAAFRGILMASSGNPKEFIQRRGRLMRPFPGKTIAEIYDFCVLPDDPSDPAGTLSVISVELKRINEFGSDALNAIEIEKIVQDRLRKIS